MFPVEEAKKSISDMTVSMATFKARLQGAEGVTFGTGQNQHDAWHRGPDKKLRENGATCSVPSKTRHACATVVDDERCRFLEAWQHELADTRREHSARAPSRAPRAPEQRSAEVHPLQYPSRRDLGKQYTSNRTMESGSAVLAVYAHKRALQPRA